MKKRITLVEILKALNSTILSVFFRYANRYNAMTNPEKIGSTASIVTLEYIILHSFGGALTSFLFMVFAFLVSIKQSIAIML